MNDSNIHFVCFRFCFPIMSETKNDHGIVNVALDYLVARKIFRGMQYFKAGHFQKRVIFFSFNEYISGKHSLKQAVRHL